MEYSELEKLPPEAYLNPDNFRTSLDGSSGNVEYCKAQYKDGLEVSKKAREITLSVRGVWGASMMDGSSLQSYEGIGYHSCTADLLRGFLDGPARIKVYRFGKDGITSTIIRECKHDWDESCNSKGERLDRCFRCGKTEGLSIS